VMEDYERERFGHSSTILNSTCLTLEIENIWFCLTREMCWSTCSPGSTCTPLVACTTLTTPVNCSKNSYVIHGV
jgi:hypothetical protein